MAKEMNSAERKKLDKSLSTELFDDTDRFEMWFAANWKKAALVVLGAIIVLCLAIYGWRHFAKTPLRGACCQARISKNFFRSAFTLTE